MDKLRLEDRAEAVLAQQFEELRNATLFVADEVEEDVRAARCQNMILSSLRKSDSPESLHDEDADQARF